MNSSTSVRSELTVIVRAKELSSYVLTVTEKSPKRFRFTLTSKLQTYTLDVIEYLYRANDVYAKSADSPEAAERLDLQHRAMTQLRLLCYMAQLAEEQGCILHKQYEQITKQAYECQNLLGGWINSDKRRLSGTGRQ